MKTFLLSLVAFSLFLLAGCLRSEAEPGEPPAAKAEDAFKVIFSQCNNAEPYRAAQNALAEKLFGAESNVNLVVMDGQADASKQIAQIETAILQKPDLLIVAPLEREPLSPVMGEAMKAGIKVICLERDIVDPNYTTYIKCDNRAIGQSVGKWIVNHLTEKNGSPKGTIVELQGNQGVEAALNRHGGAHDILAKHPEIKVVHDAVGNWFQDEAMNRMSEALTANKPGTIDVVYGHNDPMAYGAYLAAKEAGREKEMVFAGVDGLAEEGAQFVKDGILGVSFEYPLCMDKAHEIGMKMLTNPDFMPENEYMMESSVIEK